MIQKPNHTSSLSATALLLLHALFTPITPLFVSCTIRNHHHAVRLEPSPRTDTPPISALQRLPPILTPTNAPTHTPHRTLISHILYQLSIPTPST